MAIKQRIVPDDYADIATALGAANSGDEIICLESGSPYTGANNRNLDPAGLDPLLIRSQYNEEHCTIDCESVAGTNGFRFVNGESNNVILDGFTIVNGNNPGAWGAGIHGNTSSPTLRNLIVHDCTNNTHGGGIGFFDEGAVPIVIKNVLVYNCQTTGAGTDGAGIYFYYADAVCSNLTITGNTAANGGGITLAGALTVTMNNSIIWNNTAAVSGNEIYILSAGGTLNLNNSCYGNGANDVVNNGVFNPVNCTTSDPLFVTGRFGDYCISQTSAGQAADSPCLNTGTGNARDNWLYKRTTRSDEFADVGVVDMGYHYVGVYVSGIPRGAMPELRWKPEITALGVADLGPEGVSAAGPRLDLRKKVMLALTARCVFDVDASGNLRIYAIASEDDDDGAGSYDTEEFTLLELPCDPGEFVQKSVAVSSVPRFMKVFAENLDVGYNVTDIEVLAAPCGTSQEKDEEMVGYDWR